jgi:hypothetical protein
MYIVSTLELPAKSKLCGATFGGESLILWWIEFAPLTKFLGEIQPFS